MTLILTNANVIDCVEEGVRNAANVVIDNGRIVSITQGELSEHDGTIIDLNGAYLLPGLWDVHMHLEYPRIPDATTAQRTTQYIYNASQGLIEAGVTALRTGGTADFIDVALRDAFASGKLLGPRIFAAGWFLTTTAGHFLTSGAALEVDGADGFAKVVREQIKAGVDHIKLNLTGGIMGPDWDRHWHSFYLSEEMEAAFTISHQRQYDVMAHAANPDAVKAALRHGAHSVEHGYIMDEECINLFLEKDAWYVPTLAISHLTKTQALSDWERRWAKDRNLPQDLMNRADAAVEEHRHWFRRALESGVKMALGSDVQPPKEATLMEIGLWVKDGATPWQTLVAATRNAAELCHAGDELGTVEPGKLADLIVVGGNPLEDVNNLRDLQMVFKEGRLVSDRRGAEVDNSHS